MYIESHALFVEIVNHFLRRVERQCYFSANHDYHAIILYKNHSRLATRPSSVWFFPRELSMASFYMAKRGRAAATATRLRRHRGTTKVVSPENPCCLFFSRMQVRFSVAGPAGKIMLVDHQVRPRATDHRWPSGRGALTLVSSLLIAKRPLTWDSGKERKATGRPRKAAASAKTPTSPGGVVPLGSNSRTNYMQTNTPVA